MSAVLPAEAEATRRVDNLRAFEADYRSRIRAYLEGLLRDLDGSAPEVAADLEPRAVSVTREWAEIAPGVKVRLDLQPFGCGPNAWIEVDGP